jgi:hypothetical protein
VANSFLKAEKIVSQGLGLLQRELILPRLVTRYSAADFVGAKNDTVNIRIPSVLQAREYGWRNDRTNPITYDELEESSIPVSLDKHVYSGLKITDEQLTLDLVSWGEQVARPQIRAVAEKLESYIATAMAAANFRHTVDYEQGDPDSEVGDMGFYRAAVSARKALNQENVPADGRVIVLGSDVEEAALLSKHLVKVDEAGSPGALRDATIGRIAGFTVIGNVNSVPADFAVAFHPTAFAFANVAPEVPSGASAGAGMTFDSLAMRWIRDYDPDRLQDRSIYSSFAGTASVEDGRDLEAGSTTFGELTDENVRAVEIEFTAYAGS